MQYVFWDEVLFGYYYCAILVKAFTFLTFCVFLGLSDGFAHLNVIMGDVLFG